jgi:long-chain acyl-CoA synthetase
MDMILLEALPACGAGASADRSLRPAAGAAGRLFRAPRGAAGVSRCAGRSHSFAEIDAASRALAAYLQSLGLQRGDRVA